MTETFIEHCVKMYNALNDLATDKKLESGNEARVFVGSYSAVWKATKISQTYYSPIRKSLEKHQAITILQRGGVKTDTVIVLHGLPADWKVDGWKGSTDLTNTVKYARLASEVRELKQSLGGVNVVKALMQIERRLVALEKTVASESNISKNK